MNTRLASARRVLATGLLLIGATGAQAAQATVTTRGGLSVATAPAPSSGASEDRPRTGCPPPTGSRLAAARDAQGRCPTAASTNPAVRSYGGGDVEATGHPGDLNAALPLLDPAFVGR